VKNAGCSEEAQGTGFSGGGCVAGGQAAHISIIFYGE